MNAITHAATIAPAAAFLVMRALHVIKREPIQIVTLGYIARSFIGLWASLWFHRGFGLPNLEELQASDSRGRR